MSKGPCKKYREEFQEAEVSDDLFKCKRCDQHPDWHERAPPATQSGNYPIPVNFIGVLTSVYYLDLMSFIWWTNFIDYFTAEIIVSAFQDFKESIAKVLKEIAENKDKLSNLDENFDHVYSRELKPIPASKVSVEQFDDFSFRVFLIDHFVASITVPNIHFEKVLLGLTKRIIALVHDDEIQIDEVKHIQPISRDVLRELLKIIIEKVSVGKSSFQHVQVQDEITFYAKNVNNKNFNGKIDEGVVDTLMSVCVLPWEFKNPMETVANSKPVTQEINHFVTQGKLTVFCKKALAQSALQTISQVQSLDEIWEHYEQPALYGILTNGLEWFIVVHEAGRWRRSSVINTTSVNSAGSLIVDSEGISCLAKAMEKVLLYAVEWCQRIQSMNTWKKCKDTDDRNGNQKTDANNDENDGGADGGGDNLSRGLAKLSLTSNTTYENGGGAKFGNRKAFKDVTLTVQNVELLARQNRTASHRRMLALFS